MRKSHILVAALTVCLASSVMLAQSAPAESTPAPTQAPAGTVKEVPTGGAPTSPTAAPGGASTSQPVKPTGGLFDGNWPLFIMIGLVVLMLVWSSRSRKKQEAKRRQVLDSLKKGDKIVTIGGIIGTVLEVREGEVTVKTDESNNVKMKFARWAIRDIGDSAKADAKSDEKKD